MIVRPASSADALAIGTLNTRSWQVAYRGLLPDALLDELSVETSARVWERTLAPGGSRSTIFVAEDDGVIAGFASVGPSRDQDATASTGEVWLIYVHLEHVRQGIGAQLFRYGLDILRAGGAIGATLWVLEGNTPACRFYEKQGWRPDGARRTDRRRGFELHEIHYRGALREIEAAGGDRAL